MRSSAQTYTALTMKDVVALAGQAKEAEPKALLRAISTRLSHWPLGPPSLSDGMTK